MSRLLTVIGVPVGARPRLSPEAKAAVRRQLERGPFLSAFDLFGAAGFLEARPSAFRIDGVLTRNWDR